MHIHIHKKKEKNMDFSLFPVVLFYLFQNGIITALPYLVRWFSENLAGWFADYTRRKRWLRTNTARKLFNSIGKFPM